MNAQTYRNCLRSASILHDRADALELTAHHNGTRDALATMAQLRTLRDAARKLTSRAMRSRSHMAMDERQAIHWERLSA